MTKRALITGISGQDGLYLGELLAGKGYEVFGTVRGKNNPKRAAVELILPSAQIIDADLTDVSSLHKALALSEPDEVYNLGALSSVGNSWESASSTTDVTAKGALNLLEATRVFAGGDISRIRFYQASSSEMFGKAQRVPQDEMTTLWPRSPYGVAKVFAHYMTVTYRESYGLHASSGILFNHESPRRGPDFVTRKITRSVARIALGLQDSMMLGNLDARRDWGFAGDYVKAMWLMVQHAEADDYVIATGTTHSIRDFLTVAFRTIGIDDWTSYVGVNPEFFRPAEVTDIVGDATKARTVLGWEPEMDFPEIVSMMVEADIAEQTAILGTRKSE